AIAVGMSLLVAVTLIPMLSSLKGRAPLAFPEEEPHPRWRPQVTWQKPLAAIGHLVGAAARLVFFAVSWVLVRIWRILVWLVSPLAGRASDLAMRGYGRAEAAYLRVLPRAIQRPGLVLGIAVAAFALSLAVVPLLGTDLIPQLAQDRFEMTVKLP